MIREIIIIIFFTVALWQRGGKFDKVQFVN